VNIPTSTATTITLVSAAYDKNDDDYDVVVGNSSEALFCEYSFNRLCPTQNSFVNF